MPWLTTNGVSLNQCSVSLPPLGVGGSWHFQGGEKNIQKIGPSVPFFFILSCLGLPPPPLPPQPMAFPMSLSDGSSRLMSHHSSCFMSHGSSCPRMTLVSCLTSHGVSCRTVHGSSWLLMGGGGSHVPRRGHVSSRLMSHGTSGRKKKRQSPHPTTHPPTHPHHAYPERRRRRRRSEEVRSANDLAGGKRAPLK